MSNILKGTLFKGTALRFDVSKEQRFEGFEEMLFDQTTHPTLMESSNFGRKKIQNRNKH
jgi:hypothetical protein